MNETLLIIEIIITFSLLLLSKRSFGKEGLFLWVGVASIIANIQVMKSVDILGISATLGNVMFASIFLATNILSESYGKKEAKKSVFIGIFSIGLYLIFTKMALLFVPNEIDIINGSMKQLFNLAPRICFASLIMYIASNLINVFLYNKLKDKFNIKRMWLKNNISTILCNCLENFGFVLIAFYGIFEMKELLEIAFSTSIIEIFITICGTPFLYLSKKIKLKEV